MKYEIIFWTYHLRIKYLTIVTGQQMMIFMFDIGSHLSFDLWMTLKRKNNIFNVISVPKLVENEVLHYILGLLCRKLQIQVDQRRPFWILAAILDSGVGIKNNYIRIWYSYGCRPLCKLCCFYPKMQDCYATPPHYPVKDEMWSTKCQPEWRILATMPQQIDSYILVKICANFVAFIQKCKIVVIFQAMPPHYRNVESRWTLARIQIIRLSVKNRWK